MVVGKLSISIRRSVCGLLEIFAGKEIGSRLISSALFAGRVGTHVYCFRPAEPFAICERPKEEKFHRAISWPARLRTITEKLRVLPLVRNWLLMFCRSFE